MKIKSPVACFQAVIASSVLALAGCHTTPKSDSSTSAMPATTETKTITLEPRADNLQSYIELVRRDVQFQKAIIVAENMDLTEEEAAEFWPIYREYEADLAKVNSQKIDLIVRFLPRAESMTDADAREVGEVAFRVEEERVKLKRQYFARFQKVIPATKAARFFQVDNQVNLAIDLRVAASLPLLKSAK